jgi:integral membrane protein
MSLLKTSIGRLRIVGFLEGISCIALFGIAMPVKYLADIPSAVKYPGWAHGLLFILYILALVMTASERGWGFKRIAIGFIASLVPGGTFVFDKSLKKEQNEIQAVV